MSDLFLPHWATWYQQGQPDSARTVDLAAAIDLLHSKRSASDYGWLSCVDPTSDQLMEVTNAVNIHPLAMQTVMNSSVHPKIVRYDDMIMISMLIMEKQEYINGSARQGSIIFLIKKNWIITIVRNAVHILDAVEGNLRENHNLMKQGTWAVAYIVADALCDAYEELSDWMGNNIYDLEEEFFTQKSLPRDRIYTAKRKILQLRHVISPLEDSLVQVLDYHNNGISIPDSMVSYFKDLLGRVTRIVDHVKTFTELVESIRQSHLAEISIRQNEDTKKISAWAAIAVVSTAVAGMYGMNFKYMPELSWKYGYPFSLAVIFVICAILYAMFRRSKWI